jgi:hypothetical protein
MHNFYYDETEHSRKITLSTVEAKNFYDNFVVVVIGWDQKQEEEIKEHYEDFEKKYSDSQSKELKSTSIKQKQFINGFASLSLRNVKLIDELLGFIQEDIKLYFSIQSKTEYIISQIFRNYKDDLPGYMDYMKYSIIKAIRMYRPEKIMDCVFEDTTNLVKELKYFFKERIEKNKENPSLKYTETLTFQCILSILESAEDVVTNEWQYDFAFDGFHKYTEEEGIKDICLVIDKEGNGKTLAAAKRIGFEHSSEADSTSATGLRMADMIAGVIAKLMKSLYSATVYNSEEEHTQKKLLGSEWFKVDQDQLNLYKRLYHIVCESDKAWYKTNVGLYADDMVLFISLLAFMNHFSDVGEIQKDIRMQGEFFNTFAIDQLNQHFLSVLKRNFDS